MKQLAFSTFALAFGLTLFITPASAERVEIQGHVLDISGGGLTVDLGALQNLKPGATGVLRRGGLRLGSVEVVRMDRDTSFLRVFDMLKGFTPRGDDVIFFIVEQPPAQVTAGAGAGLGGEELTPLLAPMPKATARKKPGYRISTRTHGSVRFWQFFQQTSPAGFSQRISRLDTEGTADRIGGTPWSLVWSGDASYLDGKHPSVSDDFRRVRLHPRRLFFAHPVSATGLLRAGRFFPNELPGRGTVDGVSLRVPVSWLKLGAIAGARPDRKFQEFSSHELLGSAYVSAESGTPGQGSYSATLGVLRTSWLGKPDELAALFDQNFDFGPILSVYETAQFDVNGGSATVHKGTRLTRFDLSLNSKLNDWLHLRGGLNHYEPIDVAAERAVAGGNSVATIDNGYWRFWTGSDQALPWNLTTDEEVSWTRSGGVLQQALWRATLTRQGVPWLPDGTAYLTGFNVPGLTGTDYGGAVGLTLPGGKFTFDSNAGFRYDRGLTGSAGSRSLSLGDFTVRLNWRPNRTWQADASATKVWQGSIHSSSVNGGLTYRW